MAVDLAAHADHRADGIAPDIFAALTEIEIVAIDENPAKLGIDQRADAGRYVRIVRGNEEIIIERGLSQRVALGIGIFRLTEHRQARQQVIVADEIDDVAVDLGQQVVAIIGNQRCITALLIEIGNEAAGVKGRQRTAGTDEIVGEAVPIEIDAALAVGVEIADVIERDIVGNAIVGRPVVAAPDSQDRRD